MSRKRRRKSRVAKPGITTRVFLPTMDGANSSKGAESTSVSCTANLVRSLASLSVINASGKCYTGDSKEEPSKLALIDPQTTMSRSSSEPMDEELWSNLPEHLHDIILAWLPLPSFFRFRCVCQRWNTIVNSRNFLSICARVPSHGPFFLMFGDPFRQKCAAYDPTLHRWHLLPLTFFLSCPFFESFVVSAAAGGLLCLEGTGSESKSLFVSNPMTRSQKKLPTMLAMKSPYVVGMVMDREQRTYKILVVQDGEYLSSQVYDSKNNSWRMTSSLHKRVALIAGTAYINGCLYSMSFGASTGVLAYNVDQGSWHEVQVKMPFALMCPQLLAHRGRLMMVGGVEEFGTLKSVHLWRLDMPKKEWVEVQRMPEKLFNMLFKSQGHHFLCVSHGDYVCFIEYFSREMLMYDIYRNSWWWLPMCTLNDYLEARSVLGFSFEPRLDALV